MNAAATALQRPDRSGEMDAFLAHIGWVGAVRRALAADASFRRYERVEYQGRVAILMDAPPPWEDVRPFLSVTEQLRQCGVSVPTILAQNIEHGFLLLEDLGDASFTRLLAADPARELALYMAATQALGVISDASRAQAETLSAALPPYDWAVYSREVALFAEWFLPQVVGVAKAAALRTEWLAHWQAIIEAAKLEQSCLVHRDYHADNLFWLADRAGYHAVGMLDYQDALWGDPLYDLVSLLEDARRDVSRPTIAHCVTHYATHQGGDENAFVTRCAVLAAQRNAKIIGIFARLCVRDGKAHYLTYLPRVWTNFMQDLQHPLLAPILNFVEYHVPPSWRGAFTADPTIGGI